MNAKQQAKPLGQLLPQNAIEKITFAFVLVLGFYGLFLALTEWNATPFMMVGILFALLLLGLLTGYLSWETRSVTEMNSKELRLHYLLLIAPTLIFCATNVIYMPMQALLGKGYSVIEYHDGETRIVGTEHSMLAFVVPFRDEVTPYNRTKETNAVCPAATSNPDDGSVVIHFQISHLIEPQRLLELHSRFSSQAQLRHNAKEAVCFDFARIAETSSPEIILGNMGAVLTPMLQGHRNLWDEFAINELQVTSVGLRRQ